MGSLILIIRNRRITAIILANDYRNGETGIKQTTEQMMMWNIRRHLAASSVQWSVLKGAIRMIWMNWHGL